MSNRRTMVMSLEIKDALGVVKELNKVQTKYIYFWDEIASKQKKNIGRVCLFKIPNEDYRKPVARRHVDE